MTDFIVFVFMTDSILRGLIINNKIDERTTQHQNFLVFAENCSWVCIVALVASRLVQTKVVGSGVMVRTEELESPVSTDLTRPFFYLLSFLLVFLLCSI